MSKSAVFGIFAIIAAAAPVSAQTAYRQGIYDSGNSAARGGLPLDSGLLTQQIPDVSGMSDAGYGLQLQPAALERLRREAVADPGAFIDERDPWEVGAAFGLAGEEPLSRQLMPNKDAKLAKVQIMVDLTEQKLTIISPTLSDTFVISSGVKGHRTPGSGRCYRPDFLDAHHHSSLYGNAPMPNSVFFNGNIAIHATEHENHLGRPASHGCVRVSLESSEKIFGEVKNYGRRATSICVVGSPPL